MIEISIDDFDQFEEAVITKEEAGAEDEPKKVKKSIAKDVSTEIEFNAEVDIGDLSKMISSFEPLQEIKYPYDHGYGITTIWGDTKLGKTVLAMAHPANILALGFESHTNLFNPWKIMFSKTPRIQIKSFDQFISEGEGEAKKNSSNIVFESVMQCLQNAQKLTPKFEWGLFDGLQNLLLICEMRMRVAHDLGFIEGFAERTIWRVRTMFMNQIFREAQKAFSKGIIFTSQTGIQKEIKGGKETGVEKEAKWVGKIKELTQTELKMSRDILEMPDGTKMMKFEASGVCKLSGWSGTHDITLTGVEDSGPKSLIKILYGSKPKYKVE